MKSISKLLLFLMKTIIDVLTAHPFAHLVLSHTINLISALLIDLNQYMPTCMVQDSSVNSAIGEDISKCCPRVIMVIYENIVGNIN